MRPDLQNIDTNGIRLRVALAGQGPLVILIHGFPESWYSWRHQIPALADAGYRVAAPDVRGYGGCDKPLAIEAYSIKNMCADIGGLIAALGAERAIVVGHDWGAAIAYRTALFHPERVRAVAGLSVPYLGRGPMPSIQLTADRRFVEHYNHVRYHESLNNLTPADVYIGRAETILVERERIKRATIANRRLQHQLQAA